jgi:hypothetical protein
MPPELPRQFTLTLEDGAMKLEADLDGHTLSYACPFQLRERETLGSLNARIADCFNRLMYDCLLELRCGERVKVRQTA